VGYLAVRRRSGMISFVTTRRPVTPQGRRPATPKPKTAPSGSRNGANTSAHSVAQSKPAGTKPPTTRVAAAKSPAKPVSTRPASGPNPRIPNRVSIHDAARPENVRKRLDNLEASAQASTGPEALTARTLIAAVVILLVAALLVPTLRGALEQSQHLAAQRALLEQTLAKSAALDAELARWEDPVFLEAQARSRLSYVRPGDKVWRPIGGEILVEDVDPLTGVRVADGVVGSTAGKPWFEALLESFLVANGPLEPEPDDLDEILTRSRTD